MEVSVQRKESDDRRRSRWTGFVKSKLVFGFDNLTPSEIPNTVAKCRGTSISFDKIIGWRFPQSEMESIRRNEFKYHFQLSLSFLHLPSGTFFGSTWMGYPLCLNDEFGDSIPDRVDIDYNEIAYLITRICDTSCLAIVEVVLSKSNIRGKSNPTQYGCGWALLNIFHPSSVDLPDVCDVSDSNSIVVSYNLLEGSPRDMLVGQDVRSLTDSLRELPGCSIQIKLGSHKRLLRAQRLISENEILSRFEAVPGLMTKHVTLPGSTESMLIACIGETETVDTVRGPAITPGSPEIAQPILIRLSDCCLEWMQRLEFESRIVKNLAQNLAVPISNDQTRVLRRTLKIGLHNGHTVIGGNWLSLDLEEDREHRDVLFPSQEVIEIRGYVPHDLMAIAFVLEYEIGTFVPLDRHVNSKTILSSTMRDDKLVTTIVVGSNVFIPFDGKTINLCSRESKSGDEDSSVEIPLRTDEVCKYLSTKPIFRDADNVVDLHSQDKLTDSDSTPCLLGFHISAFDSSQFEIKHGQAVKLESVQTPFGGVVDHDVEESEQIAPAKSSKRTPADEKGGRDRQESKSSMTHKQKVVVRSKLTDAIPDRRDDESVADSLVSGTSEVSSLNLESRYYSDGTRSRRPVISDTASAVSHGASEGEHFLLPAKLHTRSLMKKALNAKLESSKTRTTRDLDGGELFPSRAIQITNYVGASSEMYVKHTHSRDISRGAKTRLSRLGVHSVLEDSTVPKFLQSGPSKQNNSQVPVDIAAESRDPLALHDISIQIVGYRPVTTDVSVGDGPRSVYFSFQFYTCQPTRSEILRLLPSDRGQVSVLARTEAGASDQTPLALRYRIDCSVKSPLEGVEFAEYLAKSILYVDVWDADSLLLIGICGIPLRRLMRQGQPTTKCTIESDIIQPQVSASDSSGISSTSVVECGPIVGSVVGSLHLILCNYGMPGERKLVPKLEEEREGVNWRISGSNESSRGSGQRPKKSVRARPLSECNPELSRALVDQRSSSGNNQVSLRSLSTIRGEESAHSLTYDDILVLFKRFQGSVRGTIQYFGDLIKLLDVPSWAIAARKLSNLYSVLESKAEGEFSRSFRKYASNGGRLNYSNLFEGLRSLFERYGVPLKHGEISVIARKFIPKADDGEVVIEVLDQFCKDEADRQEWLSVSKRLRSACQKACILGEDIDQVLSEFDVDGSHSISVQDLRKFLTQLSKYGKLSANDITVACRRLSESNAKRGTVSLVEVMGFFGKKYVGNIKARLRNLLDISCKPDSPLSWIDAFRTQFEQTGRRGEIQLSFEDIETVFNSVGVFREISQELVRKLLVMIDSGGRNKLSQSDIASYLKCSHGISSTKAASFDAEALLRLLLQRVQEHGIAVDEAFRHFDSNGDSVISAAELEEGLSRLGIFDNIPDWKHQIAAIVKKFDSNSDGTVSLKEFFRFLGISDYAPNIIQRMTKVFAVAIQKGLSIEAIFREFDKDGDGCVDAKEIQSGIERLNIFCDISEVDSKAVISQFDQDGDGKISLKEFISFFSSRVQQATNERFGKKRLTILGKKFRELINTVVSSGGTIADLFSHFDKDKSGSLTVTEFVDGLRGLKPFQELTEADFEGLVSLLDADGSGEVSLSEFQRFVNASEDGETSSQTKFDVEMQAERIRSVFRNAEKDGISIERAFNYVDKDGSGELSVEEFTQVLKRFKDFSSSEIAQIMSILDTDHSGHISLEEFKSFVENRPKRSSVEIKRNPPQTQSHREVLIQNVHRIAKADGGVDGLVAYLDEDEDGLIGLSSIIRLLRREGVFDLVPELEVRRLLEPMQRGDSVMAVALLRFLEGRELDETSVQVDDVMEEMEKLSAAETDYKFSSDLEIRSLEKKIRSVGRSLAKKGVDVEGLFKSHDTRGSGMIRRSEFIDILSELGLYLLEKGKIMQESVDGDVRRNQLQQVRKLKGGDDSGRHGGALGRKFQSENKNQEFSEHLEAMAMIKSYRQSHKLFALQKILSNSLASEISLFPRFGKTLFFEHSITNPFGHEERFVIDIPSQESELRLITNLEEWLYFREHCSPCTGSLGQDPLEAEMFDRDGYGNVQVMLLPHETLHLPFTFMTLIPFSSSTRRSRERGGAVRDTTDSMERNIEVKIISGTHGHIVSVLRVIVNPMPFVLNRTVRYFEPENSLMKRRIRLVGYERLSSSADLSRYVHCVQTDSNDSSASSEGSPSRVVIEWCNSSNSRDLGVESLDLILRYRCKSFPSIGSFFLLIYEDSFQARLCETWQIVVQTRQRVDIHGSVGSTSEVDLIVRGDKFSRRVRAFSSSNSADFRFRPHTSFQLVPGAFNRIVASLVLSQIGSSRREINLVDVDSKELISAWILSATVDAPAVMRTYDVILRAGKPILKKIIFQNPWDAPRKYKLVSSNTAIMKPRSEWLEVSAHGTAYMRLLFESSGRQNLTEQVYLFMNDQDGLNEECFLFQIQQGTGHAEINELDF